MKKRLTVILLTVLLVLSLLSACSGGQTTAATTAAGTTAAASTAAAGTTVVATTAAATTAGTMAAGTTVAGTTAAAATTAVTTAAAASNQPEYLNLESTWPVVKDGYDISLDFYTTQGPDNAADWEENWYMLHLIDKSNINLNYTQIPADALAEQRNLMLNSGEIPDIMYGFDFSTSQMVIYGQELGMFLDMTPYITEELMPTATRRFDERPYAKADSTLPNGCIYGLPRIGAMIPPSGCDSCNWNMKSLELLGIEMPTTLDEFTDALYAWKDADPYGKGDDNYPFASCDSLGNGTMFLLSAFGFVSGGKGNTLALRNGEVVYVAYEDAFGEYLKLFHSYFSDGIVTPDFYTIDGTQYNAMIADSKILFMGTYAPYVRIKEPADAFKDYWVATPLTSEWNDTPVAGRSKGLILNGYVLSADIKYPEAAMRLADFFFTEENSILCRNGPYKDSEDTYGLFDEGWHLEGNAIYYGSLTLAEFNATTEKPRRNQLFICANNESVGITSDYYQNFNAVSMMKYYLGEGWHEVVYNMDSGDDHYKAAISQSIMQYATPRLFASAFYFDEATSYRIADLQTLINDYAANEIAKFVTGIRDLNEFDAFRAELKSLGVEEYIQYYADAYKK